MNERACGRRNHVRVDGEMRRCIAAILDDNPVLTLDAINTTLRERLSQKPRVHSRTIAKILDGMLYTVKLVRRCPAERNRPDVTQSRRQYAAWFLEEAIRNQVIFVDECMWIQYMDGQKSRKSSTRRESISSGRRSKGKQHYHHPCSFIYIWADTSLYTHRGHKSSQVSNIPTRVCRKRA